MELESLLTALPVQQWRTRQAVVFDWHDGPRAGVCQLAQPGCEFGFELLDERYVPDGLDDRLFRLSELPAGSVADILTALRELGGPAGPVWTPCWQFPSQAAQARAEQCLQAIEARARQTCLVVWTADMENYLGCWRVPRPDQAAVDWFAALGLTPGIPAPL